MEKINKVFVYMALLAMFIYPISIYGSVLICVTAVVLSIALIREKELTNKVLQPALLLAVLVVVRSVFTLILSIIQKFAYVAENFEVYNNVNNTINVIDGILLIVLIFFLVIATVFIVMNKDIPFVSALSAKISGTEQPKEERPVKPAKKTTSVTKVKTKKSGKKNVIIIDATKKADNNSNDETKE